MHCSTDVHDGGSNRAAVVWIAGGVDGAGSLLRCHAPPGHGEGSGRGLRTAWERANTAVVRIRPTRTDAESAKVYALVWLLLRPLQPGDSEQVAHVYSCGGTVVV